MQRRYRLRRATDFERLRHRGRRLHHPLVFLVVNSNELQISRFAFAADRRVGRATDRNRAKRLLREAVRLNRQDIENGWDCLFIARQATVAAAFSEVEEAMLQLLRRAKILRTFREPKT
jgi:ribonuclease P protein component